jgi:hypothetical protein
VDITSATVPRVTLRQGLYGVGRCHWEGQLSPSVSEGVLFRWLHLDSAVLCLRGLCSLMTRDPETRGG